jgi:hypothetical protein
MGVIYVLSCNSVEIRRPVCPMLFRAKFRKLLQPCLNSEAVTTWKLKQPRIVLSLNVWAYVIKQCVSRS